MYRPVNTYHSHCIIHSQLLFLSFSLSVYLMRFVLSCSNLMYFVHDLQMSECYQ